MNTMRCLKKMRYVAVIGTLLVLGKGAYAHNPPSPDEKARSCQAARDEAILALAATVEDSLVTEAALIVLSLRDSARCRDPLDRDYDEIAQPVVPTVSTLLSALSPSKPSAKQAAADQVATNFILNAAQLIGYSDAVTTTTNRMMTARVTQHLSAASAQWAALRRYRLHFGYIQALDLRLRGQLASAWQSSRLDRKITQTDIANFIAYLDRKGLPAAEIPMLKELGLTDDDILVATAGAYSSAQAVVGKSPVTLLRDTQRHALSVMITRDLAGSCAAVAFVEASLELSNSDPGFLPEGDLNGDNIVDSQDLALAHSELPTGVVCP